MGKSMCIRLGGRGGGGGADPPVGVGGFAGIIGGGPVSDDVNDGGDDADDAGGGDDRGWRFNDAPLGVSGSILTVVVVGPPINNDGRRPLAGVELGVLAMDNDDAAIPPPSVGARAIGDDTVATANSVRDKVLFCFSSFLSTATTSGLRIG